MNEISILLVLAVLFGVAAFVITYLKKTENNQAIRALAVVSVFAGAFWVSVVTLVWAVLEYAGVLDMKKGKK
ncbi:MAG: hypothetical protein FWC51_03270 [Proteobacteria bacterium]|nr:hypothetical protein [Pseudomonadota bacterium]